MAEVVNAPPKEASKEELKGQVPSKSELLGMIEKDDEGLTEEESYTGEEPKVETKLEDLSPREQQAAAQGWMPEEVWIAAGKDAKQWRPAETWLERGDFFQTIAQLRQEVAKSNNLVAAAFEQGRKLEAEKYKEQIATLKEQRKEARQEGDFTKADAIEDKIDALKDKVGAEAPKVPKGPVTPPPEFGLFKQRNQWYDKDAALH